MFPKRLIRKQAKRETEEHDLSYHRRNFYKLKNLNKKAVKAMSSYMLR